ncbi:HTH-type transcriptional regulator CysL [bioreactor metagenome]|uniref:HTH-type transcriptional regulator CysL n=1 Tax=bioreactor metagenome TaxID=1076179 RepID=A0A644XVF3_9ZZZZ
MQAFDIEQLRTFVNIAEAGTVTAGAQRVFLSQSAASEQIRKLEDRAGQQLLQRGRHGAVTTPAGERLLQHARRLLALSDEAWRDMHGAPLQGELRLAITDYFRPSELAGLLARLASRHPAVRLSVTICKSANVIQGYAKGEFDIGLAMGMPMQKTSGTLVRKEALQWMGAADASPRWLVKARGEPLPLITLTEGCALRSFTEKLLKQRKISFTVAHVASGVAGMQAALVAGLGVACLNASALTPGLMVLKPREYGLPALRPVSFHLLPARRAEDPLAGQVRSLLAEHLAAQ